MQVGTSPKNWSKEPTPHASSFGFSKYSKKARLHPHQESRPGYGPNLRSN